MTAKTMMMQKLLHHQGFRLESRLFLSLLIYAHAVINCNGSRSENRSGDRSGRRSLRGIIKPQGMIAVVPRMGSVVVSRNHNLRGPTLGTIAFNDCGVLQNVVDFLI